MRYLDGYDDGSDECEDVEVKVQRRIKTTEKAVLFQTKKGKGMWFPKCMLEDCWEKTAIEGYIMVPACCMDGKKEIDLYA